MEKKNKKKDEGNLKNLVVVLILIVVMAAAAGLFVKNITTQKVEKETSNGFEFIKSGNFWNTTIRNQQTYQEFNLDFRYPPSQVKNISVQGDPKKFLNLLKVNNLTAAYLTFDPTSNITSANTLAAADISKLLKVINGVTIVAGCTKNETNACYNRPIITCENQLDKAFVIYMKDSNISKLSMNKNCLTIEGNGDSLIKAYTKLLFLWYNIL